MQAPEAMTAEIHTVAPDAIVAEAAELIIGSGYGAIPVVRSDRSLLGVVTRLALTVTQNAPPAGVAAPMVTHHGQQAAVTKDGLLLGVLRLQDIIERIAWRG